MMRQVAWAAAVAIGAFCQAAQAAEIACGEDYVTQPGETVSMVSAKAYDPGINRQLFVNALIHRHAVLGGALPEGTVITVPCASASGLDLPKEYWSVSSGAPIAVTVLTAWYEPSVAAAPGGSQSVFHALLGGLLQNGALTGSYETLPQDGVAELQPFADAEARGEISFPWFAADCVGPRRTEALCAAALWSDPLFEITSGIFTRSGAGSNSLARLAQQGLCIADESRSAVEASNLIEARLLARASGGEAARCLAALRSGAVSAVIVPDFAVALDARANGSAEPVQRVPGVVFADTVHAVVDGRLPHAKRLLGRLNKGLEKIRVSGDWYEIVRVELSKGLIN